MSLFLTLLISMFYWLNPASSIAMLENPLDDMADTSSSDIFQILNTKEYLPNEEDLPKPSILKNVDNDATYILSKLSDEQLIKLLTQQPKKVEYDLNDIANIATNAKEASTYQFRDKPKNPQPDTAYFKLDDKEVEPYNYNSENDPKYNALQKLNNLLYSRPQHRSSEENDNTNEMLFDVLVAQLKSLCCKKTKPKTNKNVYKLNSLLKKVMGQKSEKKFDLSDKMKIIQQSEKPKEHIFLIINDEIRSNVSEDLIAVDPESLAKNSSVLLLGPITTPLTDIQLKLVMSRISNELSKPEYLPLLKKISEGVVGDNNFGLMKSLITGPDSRRYIKPHRCNHQSKLARVYGGPKWLICTGYLNLNTPSLYD